jgi:hypothetical protein
MHDGALRRPKMKQDAIAKAITTLTRHIRMYAHLTAWDISHLPTSLEIEARKRAIEAICKKLDALAQASEPHTISSRTLASL